MSWRRCRTPTRRMPGERCAAPGLGDELEESSATIGDSQEVLLVAIVHPVAPRTPAPVPPEAIASIRAPFRRATLLPGMAYHDEGVFAWEREEIFFRDWIAVGRAEEIPDPGTFI